MILGSMNRWVVHSRTTRTRSDWFGSTESLKRFDSKEQFIHESAHYNIHPANKRSLSQKYNNSLNGQLKAQVVLVRYHFKEMTRLLLKQIVVCIVAQMLRITWLALWNCFFNPATDIFIRVRPQTFHMNKRVGMVESVYYLCPWVHIALHPLPSVAMYTVIVHLGTLPRFDWWGCAEILQLGRS